MDNPSQISPEKLTFFKNKAKEIRRQTFEMVIKAGKGHLGGSFSIVELLVVLYHGGILRFNPKNLKWDKRDIFILSKGHSSNSLYVILSDLGFFPKSELDIFSKNGSILGQHCDVNVPGIENISGSLGHGLGFGSGVAFGYKIDRKDNLVFVILGDGECQEGSTWEAAMFAGHRELNNLTAIIDRNRLGSEEFTEKTCRLEPLAEKWKDFGWDVKEITGHDFSEIITTLESCRDKSRVRPLAIISNTVKGKGLSCLENTPRSHHTLPKGEEIELSRKELT